MPQTRLSRRQVRTPLAALAFLLCAAASGFEINGVTLPERVNSGARGAALVLNGAGVRTRLGFKIYIAALYLPKQNKYAEQILRGNQPSRLSMRLLHNMTSAQFTDTINRTLHDTLTPAQALPLASRVEQLLAAFATVNEMQAGSEIVIDYEPAAGTRISLNGETKASIPGADFNQGLLRMWIGDHPRDAALKQALLGGY
jgi:hypothetical protein